MVRNHSDCMRNNIHSRFFLFVWFCFDFALVIYIVWCFAALCCVFSLLTLLKLNHVTQISTSSLFRSCFSLEGQYLVYPWLWFLNNLRLKWFCVHVCRSLFVCSTLTQANRSYITGSTLFPRHLRCAAEWFILILANTTTQRQY